jgi:hypothetical protein
VQRILIRRAQVKELRQSVDQAGAHVTGDLVCAAEEYRRCGIIGIIMRVAY